MGAIDLRNNITGNVSIVPAVHTAATVTGTGVDVSAGFSAAVAIYTGARTGGNYAFALDHSNESAANFVAVPAAQLDGTFAAFGAAGDVNKLLTKVGYKGNRKFLRVVATGTATPNMAFTAVVLVGDPREIPA